jgi:hypothetical protein
MSIRLTSRSAACLLVLTLIGVFATASVRTNGIAQETAGATAIAGIDIPALTVAAGTAYLPVLSAYDPI